jgi:hypothetical protein
MKMLEDNQPKDGGSAETVDSEWKSLYKIAAIAALVIFVLWLVETIGFAIWFPPTTVIGYFTLFQSNKLLGLFDFYLLDLISFVFFIPVFLALYAALGRFSRSWIAIATALVFVGNTIYLVSNTAFCMLSLSNQYAAATTEAQKTIYLAAGQALFTLFNVTNDYLAYILFSSWGIIISIVMVRSKVFSKANGYAGILANLVALGSIAVAFVSSTAEVVCLAVSFLFLEVWLILFAQRLFKMSLGLGNQANLARKEVKQE